MEGEVEICKKSCISSTNWSVSNGSLDDSISFETPISSINEDFHDSKSLKHQSVVLNSSSSDSTPCDIKLSFEQRHEIRQVYVRSTARIFEIYYETGPESSNEYLCTVRCGVAAKEDVHLSANDTEEANFEHVEGSIDQNEVLEDKVQSDSNSNTDEDGWVEVKVSETAVLDSKTCFVPENIDRNTERSIQDFYEATAEITDSNPCISITLRLLSLHTKGCIHLEEIYIFGEPIEPADSDDKMDPMKRSAESSIMAMLVPTLLQLSKTGKSKSTQDKHNSDLRQEWKCQNDEPPVPYPGRTIQEKAQSSLPNQEEVTVEATTKGNEKSAQVQFDEPVSGIGQRPDFVTRLNDPSSDRMERVLDQLVCRIGRIEDFCLRFEDNMLKPISNIETRLERLEKQMEVLTVRSQPSELCPCTRIVAPDFSCVDSETNSLPNDENENNRCGMSDFASKGTNVVRRPECFSAESTSSPPNGMNDDHGFVETGSFLNDDAVVAPQLYPGLIIRAPEFSNEQDEYDDDGLRGVGSGNDNGSCNEDVSAKTSLPVNKPSLSIDDALSMALAGFMSSASAQPPKTNHSWVFKAPDYSDSSTSPSKTSFRRYEDSSRGFAESDGTKNSTNLISSSCDSSTEAVIRGCLFQEEGTDGSYGDNSVNQIITGNSDEVEGGVKNYIMEANTGEFATPANEIQVARLSNADSTEAVIIGPVRGHLLREEGTDFHEKNANQTVFANIDEMAREVWRVEYATNGLATLEVDSDPDLSLNEEDVMKSHVASPENNRDEVETIREQNFNSIVDFELPVLDVKFVSHGHLNTSSSLETLLGDATESKAEDSCAEDNEGSVAVAGQSELLLEDKEFEVPPIDNLHVVSNDVEHLSVNTEIPVTEEFIVRPTDNLHFEMDNVTVKTEMIEELEVPSINLHIEIDDVTVNAEIPVIEIPDSP